MCGIVGYIGNRNALPLIIEGLKRLEYRGYDSAGVALFSKGNLIVRKKVGKVSNLEHALADVSFTSTVGLGHTRWATHGVPNDVNAHPHTDCNGRIALIHNGVIENFTSLKTKLLQQGHVFKSDTDTEVLVHLVEAFYSRLHGLEKAVRAALKEVVGTYGILFCVLMNPINL